MNTLLVGFDSILNHLPPHSRLCRIILSQIKTFLPIGYTAMKHRRNSNWILNTQFSHLRTTFIYAYITGAADGPLACGRLPDRVASTHSDPLGNRTVLLQLLRQMALNPERLVGRLECKELIVSCAHCPGHVAEADDGDFRR